MGIHTRKRHNKIKQIVIVRDGLICCYCEKPLTIQSITMDQIKFEQIYNRKVIKFNFEKLIKIIESSTY
jgi:hypothetical protein